MSKDPFEAARKHTPDALIAAGGLGAIAAAMAGGNPQAVNADAPEPEDAGVADIAVEGPNTADGPSGADETDEEATTDHDEASTVNPASHKLDELQAMARDEGVSDEGTKAEIAERINAKRAE